MERLSLWFVALALAVVFADPARPDPVDTGSGAQRNFLWHAGDGSVKLLPNSVSLASVVNTDYDPLLDNADAPNPPYANSYCPTNGLRGTSAEPIGCYSNRPELFEIEDRKVFPGLDTIFEVGGADGELGPNPDYFLADPVDSCEEMRGIMDEFRDRYGDADPSNDPTTQDFESLFRGLAYEDDGSALVASLLPLAQRANPFRGRETPTQIIRPLIGGATARSAGQRYHILDVASGVFDPAADCDTGACTYGPDDPVDERLCMLEELTIGAQDVDVPIGGHVPSAGPQWFGPYPNRFFRESFGGDFSGIIARFMTYTNRAVFGDRLKETNFVEQIAASDVPGYLSLSFQDSIPYTNVAVVGGAGELPMRVAPDQSSLVEPDPLVAQGLDYPFSVGAAAYERNVDPNTGRMRKAGATGLCENAAGFQVNFFGRQPILHAGNARLEFMEGDASAAPTGEVSPTNTTDDYARRAEPYTMLGIGIDGDCLKPGGAPGFPNENRYDPSKAPPDPAIFPGGYSSSVFANPVPTDTYIYQTLGQWALEGSSEDFALEHHPANQSLFAWICSASTGYFPGLTPGACLLNLFGSPKPLIPLQGAPTGIVPFSEFFSVLTAGEVDQDVQNYFGWRMLIANTKSPHDSIGFIPVSSLNRDVRDGLVTATHSWVVRGGDPWSPENLLTLDSTLTSEQKALLGCGPFSGTRCDSGAMGSVGLWPFEEGGGVDLLNAEGSAVSEATPGTYGTGDVTPRHVPGIGPFVGSSETLVDTWVTWSGDTQPGTIGFMGSPVCMRHAPESPYADAEGNVRLPGCRGAKSVTIAEEGAFFGLPTIEVVFDQHFSPRQDGCPFGRSMTARDGTLYTVVAVNEDGSISGGEAARINAEMTGTCFNTNGAQVSLRSTTRYQADPTQGYIGESQSVLGSRTLFHPLAGCESAGLDHRGNPPFLGPDAGFLCDFRFRNFEADFIEGNAQIFRNEVAAWSWNFLMLLAVTSCDSASGGDDLADPDCFDPELAWDVTRCSLSAPHLCRNAQILLELTSDATATVAIDIKPGRDHNFIRPFSRELIPVALLGSDSFDVADVDVATLAFGPDGASPAFDLTNPFVYWLSHRDVNHDGKWDLLSSYRASETGIVLGDTDACLSGETRDGTPFEGCDAITTATGCGIGCELALLLPPLMWLYGRRGRRGV